MTTYVNRIQRVFHSLYHWLYEFSWRDALIIGSVLLLMAIGIAVFFWQIPIVPYASNFLFGLGILSLLIGVIWGVLDALVRYL